MYVCTFSFKTFFWLPLVHVTWCRMHLVTFYHWEFEFSLSWKFYVESALLPVHSFLFIVLLAKTKNQILKKQRAKKSSKTDSGRGLKNRLLYSRGQHLFKLTNGNSNAISQRLERRPRNVRKKHTCYRSRRRSSSSQPMLQPSSTLHVVQRPNEISIFLDRHYELADDGWPVLLSLWYSRTYVL